MNKEKNFISAVVYLHNDGERAIRFLELLCRELETHFEQYELVTVEDACTDDTIPRLRAWAKELQKPLTVLHMSLYQPREQCMNAGLDIAIGDYVYEFDTTETPYPAELVFGAYQRAQAGSDIVSVCPTRGSGTSRLFYRVFNANSHAAYNLRTDAFRLVSRRAINRVHATSENLPYRKAAYAASGLRMETLDFAGRIQEKAAGRLSLAADSLALYTDAGFKLSAGIALAMMLLAVAELVYTLAVFFTGHPIEGWTTMMFVLTVGFAGVFGLLTIVIKYLSLLVELVFRKQRYFVESIEKIQK